MISDSNGFPGGGALVTTNALGKAIIPSIQTTTGLVDINSVPLLGVSINNVAPAINYFQISNAVLASHPAIAAVGADTDLNVVLTPKGFGNLTLTSGSIGLANKAVPSTPTSAHLYLYGDNTDNRFHDINDAGEIGTTVVSVASVTHNFLTAISASGVVSKARPSAANLSDGTTGISGAVVLASGPTLTTPSFTTGFKINAAAAAGIIPRGDGTNYIPSTFTLDNPGGAGQVLRSNSVNWISTAIQAGDLTTAVQSDLAFTGAQTITFTDAETGGASVAELSLVHLTTGTPANVLGSTLAFSAESSTNATREQARISTGWTTVTDASRAAYLDFLCVANASLTSKMRLFPKGDLNVGGTTDPSSGGIIVATTGYWVGSSASGSGKILISDGSKFTASGPAYPATATASTVVTGDGSNFSANVNGRVIAGVSTGSTTTSTSLVDLAGMTCALTAGTWLWEVVVIGQSSSTAGTQFGVNYSGTTTSIDGMHTGQLAGTTFTATTRITAVNTASTVVMTTATTECEVYMTGQIVVSNSGNLTAKGLKVTSGTLTYRSGSWIKATRVS